MSTSDEIEAALESGEAFLRYDVPGEAFYATAARARWGSNVFAEFSVGVDSADGGTFGEWSVEHVAGIGMRHLIFDDAPEALAAAIRRGYLAAMAAHTPAEFRAALDVLGFRDLTKRVSPYTTPTISTTGRP